MDSTMSRNVRSISIVCGLLVSAGFAAAQPAPADTDIGAFVSAEEPGADEPSGPPPNGRVYREPGPRGKYYIWDGNTKTYYPKGTVIIADPRIRDSNGNPVPPFPVRQNGLPTDPPGGGPGPHDPEIERIIRERADGAAHMPATAGTVFYSLNMDSAMTSYFAGIGAFAAPPVGGQAGMMAMLLWTPDGGSTQLRQMLGSSTADGLTPVLLECDASIDLFSRSNGSGAWQMIDRSVTQGMSDMTTVAFTVTPAPGSVALLGLGGLMLCKRRVRAL